MSERDGTEPQGQDEPGVTSKVQQIRQLLGERVTVTNPDFPDAPWTGILTGRYDEPTITLAMADGGDRALPQRFDIAAAGPEVTSDLDGMTGEQRAAFAALAAENHGLGQCENCQAQSALESMRAALRSVLLPWMDGQDDTMTARRLRTTLEAGLDEIEDLIRFASCG